MSRIVAVVLTVLVLAAPCRAADPPVEIIRPKEDSKLEKRLEAARDLIKEENWPKVVQVLQDLLDSTKQDTVVNGADGKPVLARAEARRLLRSLPAEGIAFYRLAYEERAKEQLKTARDNIDLKLLAEAARRYADLGAGLEALELLASYHFDVGNPKLGAMLQGLPPPPGPDQPDADALVRAALAYDQLLDASGGSKGWSPATLCKAAAAFWFVGDHAKSDRLWKQLTGVVGKDGLKAGARRVALTELRALIDDLPDWPIFGGNASRSGRGSGGAPFLEKIFMQLTIERIEPSGRSVVEAVTSLERRKEAVLPAFYPVLATPTVAVKRAPVRTSLAYYRSYRAIQALDLTSGKLVWEAESEWSLDRMYRDTNKVQALLNWTRILKHSGRLGIGFENSVLGMLSLDSQRLYAVEDLAVPPYMGPLKIDDKDVQKPWGQKIDDAIHHNKLQAYDLGSGKLVWELGGRGKGQLDDSFFLGVPMPLGGRLYGLTEKDREIRLVCLEPKRGKVDWVVPVAKVREKLLDDVLRRSTAAPLAYGEGILVCPTNAGAIVGVDLQSRNLIWGHVYRDDDKLGGAVRWSASAPVVADGNVVFSAMDTGSVHCLGLRDGALRWKTPRGDDLYLAGVYGDKVFLVGKDKCRALSLKDGKQLWIIKTGLPSGRGIAAGDLYYLPLKSATLTREPEVCIINLAKGQIVAHTRSRWKEVPGNLLFADGMVLSQTATELVAYPQLKVKLQEIEDRLRKDPKDPAGLTARAELRLDRGDMKGAIDDLHAALANKPSGKLLVRARSKLYEALTELLQRDPDGGVKYLEEYKKLIELDVDARTSVSERRLSFLLLTAQVYEKRGKVIEALKAYLEIADKADPKELFRTIDDPSSKATPTAWARGRIKAMIGRANAEQRKLLEADIEKRRKAILESKDLEALRKFVEIFGSDSTSGREARLQLAEMILAKRGAWTFFEAEQHLLILRQQSDDPNLAGRAVEALARLMVTKGLLDDAVHYYRILGRDFAKVAIRDGKTGADFLDGIATDKRFLPFFTEPPKWKGRMRATQEEGEFGPAPTLFFFEHQGERLPFFQRHRVAIRLDFHQFKLIDRKTGEERWAMNLNRTDFMKLVNHGEYYTPQLPYHAVGHMVVLPVAERVFGIDPVHRKVMWEHSLAGQQPLQRIQNVHVDPRDGQLVVEPVPGFQYRLGQLGIVQPSYVCLLTHDGLLAVDPLSGLTLWTRNDVPSRAELFGDAEHVYLVEVDAKGKASGARAFRAADGVSVKVPDFAAAYQNRSRILGGKILTTHTDPKLGTTLRLYEIQTGKDAWKRTFKPGALVLRSQETDLTGAVEPNGAVTILDFAGKDVAKSKIDAEHLRKAQAVHLLRDQLHFYLAINGPKGEDRLTRPNFTIGNGLRAVPVNGWLYAINRANGKMRWNVEATDQLLLTDDLAAMPMVLLTARTDDWNGHFTRHQAAIRAVDKQTGKIVFDAAELEKYSRFHALKVDPAAGKIELVSEDLKITFSSADARPKQ
jgi:outer membrane protein assembly factor BamB